MGISCKKYFGKNEGIFRKAIKDGEKLKKDEYIKEKVINKNKK